jgi:four helix bundle protein
VPVTPVTMPLITQLVKASTSVGANYTEADDAVSRRDYRHRTGICRKESKESRFWLRMIAAWESDLQHDAAVLSQEAHELNKIFGAILRKTQADSD